MRDRAVRAMPAPEANAELQANLDVCHILLSNYIFAIPVHLSLSCPIDIFLVGNRVYVKNVCFLQHPQQFKPAG